MDLYDIKYHYVCRNNDRRAMPNLLAVMRAHTCRPLLVSDRFLDHCCVLAGLVKGLAELVNDGPLVTAILQVFSCNDRM